MLLVDNGSIYTKNLEQTLEGIGVGFELVRPGMRDPDGLGRCDGVILSGRRHNDHATNVFNTRVVRRAVRDGTKLLGICYGAEILALALGGTIRRRASPRSGAKTVRTIRENPISAGPLDVYESHRYEMASLPACLIPLAESDSCRYEMIRHETEPVFGVQFHPEMSPDGQGLIERFCLL